MLVLGIETSCDESAVSILDVPATGRPKILCELIASQTTLHESYGGVVPELAAREHLKNLPLLFNEALSRSGTKLPDIDAIAVTRGPGLKGCLLMGLGFAKAVSIASGKLLIGINHIEGHVFSPFLDTDIAYPYIALVVSGGHTELHYVTAVGQYTLLGRTSDDAAGEAFDKSANLLGFVYPGGAALSKKADEFGRSSFQLPRVMREAEGFSFSGLKTAVHLLIKKQEKNGPLGDELKADLCAAVQEAIVDALIYKLKKAVVQTGVKNIAVVGGVAANKKLHSEAKKIPGVQVFVPNAIHCTDNASMIAYVGALRSAANKRSQLSDGALPRWLLEECRIP